MDNLTVLTGSAYTHLGLNERDHIAVLHAKNYSITDIGKSLKRHKSTISRELNRNQPPVNEVQYRANQADTRAAQRWKESHQKIRIANEVVRKYIVEKLKLGWTPQLIAGRIGFDHPGHSTNHESIYQFIYIEAPTLRKHLPRSHKKRHKRGQAAFKHKSRIPNRVPIALRPEPINTREEFGNWEADTIVSRSSRSVLMVIIERKSRYVCIEIIQRKTALEMELAICKKLKIFEKDALKSITYDNGTENTNHENVNKKLGTISFFCILWLR